MDIAQKKLSKYKEENGLVDTGNVKQLKINEIQSISKRIIEDYHKGKILVKNSELNKGTTFQIILAKIT